MPRLKIPPRAMWDLTDLYATPEAWSASYARTRAAAEKLDRYKGTLGTSASAMFTALDAISTLQKQTSRLAVYGYLKADEDTRVAINQERRQQAQALSTLIGEQTAWVVPEIIEIGAAKVRAFVAQNQGARHPIWLLPRRCAAVRAAHAGRGSGGRVGGGGYCAGPARRHTKPIGQLRIALPELHPAGWREGAAR